MQGGTPAIKATYGYHKQGTGYGYSGIKGLNALLGTVTTNQAAPIIVGARLRKGAANSARGAGKLVADLLANVSRLRSTDAAGMVLLRADSAYYGSANSCRPASAANFITGTSPAADTRFGSSNEADTTLRL